jgi:hypothetical protein
MTFRTYVPCVVCLLATWACGGQVSLPDAKFQIPVPPEAKLVDTTYADTGEDFKEQPESLRLTENDKGNEKSQRHGQEYATEAEQHSITFPVVWRHQSLVQKVSQAIQREPEQKNLSRRFACPLAFPRLQPRQLSSRD